MINYRDILENQKNRLTSVYSDKGITPAQIDMVIDHSYYLLNEVSRVTAERVTEIEKKQKTLIKIVRTIIGFIASLFIGLLVSYLTM